MIIEIGVGYKKVFEDSICIDIRKTPVVDIIADVRYLPIRDESVDKLFSSHVIEHFPHQDVKSVLTEWLRILKKDGEIELRCPDLRARAFLFAMRPSWEDVKNIYGGQDYPENFHQSGFSFRIMSELLNECDVGNIKRIYDGYKGIPFLPSDLHVKGKK